MSAASTARQWLSDKIAPKRAATNPIPITQQQAVSFRGGLGSTQPSAPILLQECIGLSNSCRSAISRRLSGLVLQVKVETPSPDGMTLELVEDPNHPLVKMLKKPHANFSKSQTVALWADWLVTLGEFYALKIGNRLGVPMELQPVPPALVSPVLSQGVVSPYDFRASSLLTCPSTRCTFLLR